MPLFASAFYVVADLENGTLIHANAGHPCPLRVRGAAALAACSAWTAANSGPPWGCWMSPYPSARTEIVMPETVLLFTDGLFEVEAQDGSLYDYQALRDAVGDWAGSMPRTSAKASSRKSASSPGKRISADDVCLVAMEIDHLAPGTGQNGHPGT